MNSDFVTAEAMSLGIFQPLKTYVEYVLVVYNLILHADCTEPNIARLLHAANRTVTKSFVFLKVNSDFF